MYLYVIDRVPGYVYIYSSVVYSIVVHAREYKIKNQHQEDTSIVHSISRYNIHASMERGKNPSQSQPRQLPQTLPCIPFSAQPINFPPLPEICTITMSQSHILPPILPISQFHNPKFRSLLGQGSWSTHAPPAVEQKSHPKTKYPYTP